MFQEKSKKLKESPNKPKLDQILWIIENYLPQKKDPCLKEKLNIENLESETVKYFSKLASLRSKKLFSTTKNR